MSSAAVVIKPKGQFAIEFNVELRTYDASLIYSKEFHGFGRVWWASPLAHCIRQVLEFATSQKYEIKNRVVDDGLEHIGKLMMGTSTTSIQYNHVGTSNASVSGSNQDLASPLPEARHLIGYKFPEGKTKTHYDTFYGDQEGNGTIHEVGLFVNQVGAPMIARALVNQPTGFQKLNTLTMTIAWTITLVAV